jgi:CheY-like chemotaxis protein
MGLFSRVRRLNGSHGTAAEQRAAAADDGSAESPAAGESADTIQPPDGVPPPVAGPPRVMTSGIVSLREGLQQLHAIRPSREAFAEEAVKLIAKGAGVKAAALLGYEQRGGRMRLLASVGLESDAVQVLSGDSMVSGWDIPLRSLRNRRINVIEAAHENPFVPRALAAISPRRLTIAALPFFHANAPVGTIVLFSPTPRGFADGLLKSLSQALRVCALALSELPLSSAATARVAADEPTGTQPNLLRGLAALKAELARLTDALEEAERARATEVAERVTAQTFLKAAQERAAALETELTELRAAQGRVPEIEAQAQQLGHRLAAASEAADAAQQQITQLQAAVAQHEQRSTQDAAAIAALTAARRGLEAQVQESLDTARQRGEEVAALHAQVAELAPRAAQASDLQTSLAATEAAKAETDTVVARLRQELLAAEGQRVRAETALEQTSAALAANETERTALTAQLAETRARIGALERSDQEHSAVQARVAALEASLAARQEELDAARAALSAGGSELSAAAERAAERIVELDTERERLATELARARGETERAAADARRHADALAEARREMEAQRESLKDGNAERAQLAARTAALERDLSAVRAEHEALTDRYAAQSQAADRQVAERRELEARIATLTAGGQSLEQERQVTLHAAQRRTAELEAEIARLTSALEATRATAAEELNRTRHDAGSTLDGLRVDLAEAARARDELQRALAASQQECAAHQRALAEMSAERARLESTAKRLTGERSELSARIDSTSAEQSALQRAHEEVLARLHAREAELRSVREQDLAALQKQLDAEREARQIGEEAFAAAESRYQDELAELRDRLADTSRERDRLVRTIEEKDLLLQSAEEGLHQGLTALDLAADTADEDSVLDIDRACAPEGATTSAELEVLAEVAAAAGGEIILIDGAASGVSAARQLVEFGHRVSALPPSPDPTEQLRERAVACAAINLADPVAWPLLRHLRNGGGIPHMPLVAYALAESSPKGFWLGPVDFALLPVGQTDLAALLNRLVHKVKRVIAMSNDIDVMSDVRTQLTATGISTAVVLDGRQALDLVSTIRPEAAVLHLSPSCADVFRAIAGLRSADISRDIPILFLLDSEAQPREEAFLTAGVRMLTGRGGLMPDGLVDSLASVFDGYRAA